MDGPEDRFYVGKKQAEMRFERVFSLISRACVVMRLPLPGLVSTRNQFLSLLSALLVLS
jgi:hypothetical protein